MYSGYVEAVFDLGQNTVEDLKVQKQISLDVTRTFGKQRIPQFIAPIESRQNVLYNVLAAYAKHAPSLGYCQGMNFLTALILLGVNFDEVSAFILLERLLSEEYGKLCSIYDGKLTRLFSLSDEMYEWLLREEPELE